MAIQNFLSGGYYGKLGATVGQRWKNKRTIRTYVVPANPRTPTQQANRGKFADAVTYAQMGMQMNYYCTLFDDPNFTKWNYRMKVARELKNAGLSGLDLIPLYPISFNPPILLTEFTKATVTGQKHISFAAPDLALNADRVLSLMFALYDEQDTFLGYKLYLGYYYASNPGYVEVDVDDVNEINTHCFVRIISNDDEDSSTDLIGSPRLAVGTSGPEVRDFNTAIREVQKTSAGIKVTFQEPWKGVPTVNEVYADMHFTYMGEVNTIEGEEALELTNENGYCAVLIPFSNGGGWALPAFPNGSYFKFTVDYEGATWQYTKTNDTVSYSDNDLLRVFNGSWTFASGANDAISWSTDFGNVTYDEEFAAFLKCSGRLDKTSEENVTVELIAEEDGYIRLDVTGDFAEYPMRSGDYLRIAQKDFVVGGVTYRISAGNINGVNARTTSNWLRSDSLTKYFVRDGGSSVGDGLITLSIDIEGIEMDTNPTYSNMFIARVNTVNGHLLTPAYCQMDLDNYDPTNPILDITANFDGQDYYEDVNTSCSIVPATLGMEFTYKGITYVFPQFPNTIGGWEV